MFIIFPASDAAQCRPTGAPLLSVQRERVCTRASYLAADAHGRFMAPLIHAETSHLTMSAFRGILGTVSLWQGSL